MDATNKRRGRSKVFGCFKSGHDHEPGSPLFSADDAAASRKIRLRRNFSAALKAVLSKTSLKKSRSENSKQESHKLRNSFLFSKSKNITKKKNSSCMHIDPAQVLRSNSDHSSLFSSNSSNQETSVSSSASSSSSHLQAHKIGRSVSMMDFKHMDKHKATTKQDCGRSSNYYSLKIEIFVVWACLFSLLWGKVFAIVICTASWLFFAPAYRRRPSRRPQPRKFDSFDTIDSEYKKRVIMEGLLDRKR